MPPPRRTRTRLERRAPGIALAVLLAAAGASASTPPAGEPDVSAWVGRYCTPLGCSGAAQSTLGNTLGFGAAAVSLAFLARRRRA